jgi:tellurium resistance protein TerD
VKWYKKRLGASVWVSIMPINLQKGGPAINLSKGNQPLTEIYVGLGWDVEQGGAIDLDASVACLGHNDKLVADEFFVFYNNLKSPDGSVVHSGDNKDGQGEGDDESIKINLAALPATVVKILLIVSISNANGKTFKNIKNAFFRIVDPLNNQETHRCDLSNLQNGNTECLVFAEIIRSPIGWAVNPVCVPVPTLQVIVNNFST